MVENVDFEGAPTMVAGGSVGPPPATITRNFRFPNLRLMGLKVIPRIVTTDESHFWPKNVDIEGSPAVCGIHPDCTPIQLRCLSTSPILRITGILKMQFPESPLPVSRIWSGTSILMDRRRWAEFSQIFARCNYGVFLLFQFTGIRRF